MDSTVTREVRAVSRCGIFPATTRGKCSAGGTAAREARERARQRREKRSRKREWLADACTYSTCRGQLRLRIPPRQSSLLQLELMTGIGIRSFRLGSPWELLCPSLNQYAPPVLSRCVIQTWHGYVSCSSDSFLSSLRSCRPVRVASPNPGMSTLMLEAAFNTVVVASSDG